MAKFTDGKIKVKEIIYSKLVYENMQCTNLYKIKDNYINIRIDKEEFDNIDYDIVKINKKFYDSFNLYVETHTFYKEIL